MSGRRRKRIKPQKNDDSKENVEPQRWSQIPHDILEMILSPLKHVDNVRASAVCKHWNTVACGVRVLRHSPWLLYLAESFGVYEFYDPSSRKRHFVDLPEIDDSRVCYSKDGWLLLYRIQAQYFYFFNPFTRELINLPKKPMVVMTVAFSAAPTSGNCIVFTQRIFNGGIIVSTCHPGATEWTTVQISDRFFCFDKRWNVSLFCKRKFYCYSSTGWLGVYDPLDGAWSSFSVEPPNWPVSVSAKHWGKFMTEYDEDIFIIDTSSKEKPTLYKWDEADRSLKDIKTVDGGTFFVSCSTCHFKVNVVGLRQNSIYFPKVRFYGKRCIFYSLDDHRYFPRKQCPDRKEEAFASIWIEPPKVFLGFT